MARYNLLNLPMEFTTAAGDTVNYVYSVDGEKLYEEENPSGGTLQGTEYAANYRIENGTVTMIHTDAGYYTPYPASSGGTVPLYKHLWYLKDHLDNNRVLVDGNGAPVALHDYDPFGEEIATVSSSQLYLLPAGAKVSPYKYGGKEWSATTSTYDFEARQFSPSFHRFTTMDLLAEKYYSISPYAYCAGNPVNLVDPEGKDTYVFDENGQYLWKNEEKGEHRIAYRTYSTDAQGRTNVSVRFYEFADPINDPQSIDSGAISQLRFFSESDIRQVLREQGADNGSIPGFAFNSIGGGDFDYAVSYFLSKKVFSAKFENGEVTSPYLFIPAGTDYAHNIMNLGNFFWAITGYIKGFNETILKTGADFNSIYLSPFNGYPSQPDSEDDQRSISEGVRYAINIICVWDYEKINNAISIDKRNPYYCVL